MSMLHFDGISILNISASNIFPEFLPFAINEHKSMCAKRKKTRLIRENIEGEIFKIEITSKCTIDINSNFWNK